MEQIKRVTIKDIARSVQLPAATVKYALNDLPGLKKEVKRQILSAAKKLGYSEQKTLKTKYRLSSHEPGSSSVSKEIVMADIAEYLQVSVSTVSRALNGSAYVGKETQELVRKTARDLGYVLNADARELRVKGLSAVANSQKMVTMCDVADNLNLSVATVSRCFSTSGDVSPETRNVVLETAREMGYTLTDYASRLRVKKRAC
jgi:DNA-binding LacI/PurR family transcriptional regulator